MPDNKGTKQKYTVARMTICAFMTVFALALSYLETFIPLGAIIPLPGIKLGLANIVVMLVFIKMSPLEGATVSFLRILLAALLFGTPVSFIYSLSGGILSFVGIVLLAPIIQREKITFAGMSVVCAVLHNVGQTAAAAVTLGSVAPFLYLPVLIVGGGVTGFVSGIVANRLYRINIYGNKG